MAPNHEERMKTLRLRRTAFKIELNSFQEVLDNFERDATDVEVVKIQLAELESEYNAFAKSQIELDGADETGELMQERIALKLAYTKGKGRALSIINSLTPQSPARDEHSPGSQQSISPVYSFDNEVTLPKINLPLFFGSYEDWPGFSDQFRSSVHDNTRINDCKKFMYLKSCVKNEAAQAINSLSISAANYTVAWDILEKRYNQPACIVATRLQSMFDIPVIQRSGHRDLRAFLNHIESHYRALQALQQPTTDTLLIYLFTSKLDEETIQKWKEYTKHTQFPKLEQLFEFLHERCQVIEPLRTKYKTPSPQVPVAHNRINQQARDQTHRPLRETRVNKPQVFVTQHGATCNFCKGSHFSQNCDDFTKLSVSERSQLVKQRNLCFNCLRRGHSVTECQAMTCKRCHLKHHTLLHFEPNVSSKPVQANATCLSINSKQSEVLLSTAIVEIVDTTGKFHPCRVLLDSCSQSHFLTEEFCRRIGLDTQNISIPLSGMNNMNSTISKRTNAKIKSRCSNYSNSLSFLVVKTISQHLPSEYIDRHDLNIPNGIRLADPTFNQPAQIDGLIGAQNFWELLCVGQISIANSTMALQKTKLGWIVTGEITSTHPIRNTTCHLSLQSLHDEVNKFWDIEECPVERILSTEESLCESHYVTNTVRESTGSYTVRLPFKGNPTTLGNSYNIALKRFLSLERALDKNPSHKEQYSTFLKEYETLGHMTKIQNDSSTGYHLPHHSIIKTDSRTTKVRVVFDASARSSSGVALNDILMVGPTIQDNLLNIVTRFRCYKYVLTADIAKMYRQVHLHREDRKYHKILWRENPCDPIQVYELNTVTYGTASAPYLAIKTLHQLAHDERDNHPVAAAILTRDFYVDDVLTGANTVAEAITIRDDLIQLCAKGGFHLRQWVSNEPNLLKPLQTNITDTHITLDVTDGKKTLGLYWNARNDTLGYTITRTESSRRTTKRTILSKIAQLFDPLGLLGPIIVQAKIIMQNLWKCQVGWDESIPLDIHTAWTTFESQLQMLRNLKIPRHVMPDTPPRQIQVHGFCDASEQAYGACIYIRCIDLAENTTVRLLCSKSRVAPLKTQSLPRLELCAAILLMKLYTNVRKSLNITINESTFWSDSMITLHWIRTAPHTLKQFVANRVGEIQRCSDPSQWRHVPTESNPADLLSRGVTPLEFTKLQSWQTGPCWLSLAEDSWPLNKLHPVENTELRKIITLQTQIKDRSNILHKFSSFTFLKRIISYCLRFSYNTRNKQKRTGPLSTSELQHAHIQIIKNLQAEVFAKELSELSSNNHSKFKPRFASLCPFIDKDGLIRVGGRLRHSEVPYSSKHPILIPQTHHITDSIIREFHIRHNHSGTQTTLHAIRQVYWPINGRESVKATLRKCITCLKAQPKIPAYLMGNLPHDRVRVNRPFLVTGIDYCGPFFIKEKRFRNTKRLKTYVAIFVCFSTKAVHIELVGDLTTEAFLAALKRFFARRGKSTNLYSDNATNFVGADRELTKTLNTMLSENNSQLIHNYLANQGIQWHFIPPRAPHFGGLWEAAVKSFKHHLVRVVGNTLFTFEELLTCLNEIEAILNSRPMIPLSSDPNDLVALTPGHFLIGDSLTSTPECDLSHVKVGRLTSWQQIQRVRQHFWTRWRKDYLNEITVRKKWHDKSTTHIKKGMLVLLKEDNIPPFCWPLGRILDTHPGDDGIIRVVTVKTAHGEYKRSVTKVAPLPLDTE